MRLRHFFAIASKYWLLVYCRIDQNTNHDSDLCVCERLKYLLIISGIRLRATNLMNKLSND